MKATKDQFLRWLAIELLRSSGPIFVAPALNSLPTEIVGSGTCALLDTGKRRLLITCSRVWDAYQEKHDASPDTVLAVSLGEGRSNIAFKNPENHCIAIDRELDLVVLEFEPRWINVTHQKNWFRLKWPLRKIAKGEHIMALGFPGAWRQVAGEACLFRCAVIPFVVSDVNDRTIAAFCDNRNAQVFNDLKDSLGGLSGSPAYGLESNGELHLVGFARLGSESASKHRASSDSTLAAVLFTQAGFLEPDGSLTGPALSTSDAQ